MRDDGRQRLDRRKLPAVQQHDLGRGSVLEQMTFDLRDGHRAPIAAVVGPQHDRVTETLRDLQRAFGVAPVRRPHQRMHGRDRAMSGQSAAAPSRISRRTWSVLSSSRFGCEYV